MTDQTDHSDPNSQQPAADTPPQPGWWKASDGNWYPPQPPPPAATPPPPGGYPVAPPTNAMATTALVLGILSICLFWAFGFGVVLGVLAIVFGILGKNKAKTLPGEFAGGRAIAGLVTGAVGSVLGVGFFVLVIAAGNAAVEEFERIGEEIDEIDSDPADGFCDEDRFWQDPDC